MTTALTTARSAGLLSCLACGLLSRPPAGVRNCTCPRCGARLHSRKPGSLIITWTFLIAAMVLYVPANTLPIMETNSLFESQEDTILSGIGFLWNSGSWPLAVIVFIASITVPLLKMVALALLLLSVHCDLAWPPRQRARLYRTLEFIGRWSMLDIYVVAILVTLVQLQTFARITPGGGALAFGAVVVLTMLAALSFDPRLIWDAASPRTEHG